MHHGGSRQIIGFVGKLWAKCGHGPNSVGGLAVCRSIWTMRTRVAAAAVILAAVTAPVACGGHTATPAATPPPKSEVTWEYLQTQYKNYLTRDCDYKNLPDSAYNACISLQETGLAAFKIDVNDLPRSAARADLLAAISQFEDDYKDYTDNFCQLDRKKIPCLMKDLGLKWQFDMLELIVNNQAGN